MKLNVTHQIMRVLLLLTLPLMLAGCGLSAQGKVVDEIMKHMAASDSAAAFEHMSQVSRDAGLTAQSLADFMNAYPTYVNGYTGMSVTNMSISTTGSETRTEMSGTFSYEDGTTGDFNAILHKEGDNWLVTELNINK